MDLRQLRYFLVLAEELHFGRAAVRLGITQPAVSHAISQLERELGVTLFERGSRGVALTHAGAAFLRPARLVLDSMERAIAAAQGLAAPPAIVSLVVARIAHLTTTPAILAAEVRAQAPGLALELREDTEGDAVAAVLDGDADVVLAIDPKLPASLRALSLRLEDGVAHVGSRSPIAAAATTTLERLSSERLVTWTPDSAPGAYAAVLAAFEARGIRPAWIEHRETRVDWEEEFAASGCTLVPASFPLFPGAVRVPLSDPLRFHELLAWRAEADDEPQIATFRRVAAACATARGWRRGDLDGIESTRRG